jgi:hypothetical protein
VLGQAVSTAISKAPGLDIRIGSAPARRKLAASSGEKHDEFGVPWRDRKELVKMTNTINENPQKDGKWN